MKCLSGATKGQLSECVTFYILMACISGLWGSAFTSHLSFKKKEKRKNKTGPWFSAHPPCNLPSPLRKRSLNALFTAQKVKELVMKEKMAFIFRGNPFLYLLNHQKCISYLVPQLFVNIIILNSAITKQTYRCLLANGTHMCVCVGRCVTGREQMPQ